MTEIFDNQPCELGEGPLWHPLRKSLFWFDILGQKLFEKSERGLALWQFDKIASAIGWIDENTLFMAMEDGLYQYDLKSATGKLLVSIEAENPGTRSNDGRADPWGGFWIGTMGKAAEDKAGSIYRYYRGDVRIIAPDITIPNAICFSKEENCAFFTDTPERIIWRQSLDPETGWPIGEKETHIDLRAEEKNPDGAIIDAKGNLWNAQWGAARVAVYDKSGAFLTEYPIPTDQPSCPAFGGDDLHTLFVTTAFEHMDEATRTSQPAGHVFMLSPSLPNGDKAIGLAEPRVIL